MRSLLYSMILVVFISFPVSAQEINEFFHETLVDIDFDFSSWPYPLYEENAKRLYELADDYPEIATLHVMGTTQEGRDMLLMEITNKATGPGEDKPGLYFDGNMHAGEVNGRPTMMYFIERTLARYGKDEKITRLVDTRVFYVNPMFDADGGERVLTRHPSWPEHKPEQHNGQDLDGDGYITQMRKKDPNGRSYESKRDPRLMLEIRRRDGGRMNYLPTTYSDILFFNWEEPDIGWKRIPGDPELFDDPMVQHEDRYAVYTEGQSFEREVSVDLAPQNFNRGWSAEWDPSLRSSGPFPFYIPELRAAVKFMTDHKNIYFYYNIHADNQAKNYIVRPPMDHPYEFMPPEDNEFYVRLGQDWSVISNGDLFESDWASQEVKVGYYGKSNHGFSIDWQYMHNGIHGLTPEFNGAGRDYDGDSYVTEFEIIRWSDEEKGGQYYVDWKSYNHPLLGEVEIGGVRALPVAVDERLKAECEKHFKLMMHISELAPVIKVLDVSSERLRRNEYKITATVQNEGWLSTYVTRNALKIRRDFPILAGISVEGGEVIEGDPLQNIGHILGKIAYIWRWGQGYDESTKTVEWTVKKTGSELLTVSVEARAHKAGRDIQRIVIENE